MMSKKYLQSMLLAVVMLTATMLAVSVFAQQKVAHKLQTKHFEKSAVLKNAQNTVSTKEKKQLPAVEMTTSQSATAVDDALKRDQKATTAKSVQPRVENVTAPPVTLNTSKPTMKYEIKEAPATRKSESVMNMVEERVTSRKRSAIYEKSTQELKALYQKARPATQAKMMADPILKERLESNE